MNTQYSQLMGSFIRTGNYPLEANYIFPSKEALVEFYSNELNATTLHKGLLRIVENDGEGKQALYWMTPKIDSTGLEFTKLISANDIESLFEQLEDLESKLDQEIKLREKGDNAIWGTLELKEIDEDLNSILDLANAIKELRLNTSTLKEELQAVVGTKEDNIINHLQTLPYQSLTEIALNLDNLITNALPEIVNNIYGTPFPSEDFRDLSSIEYFVRLLKSQSEHADSNLQSELDQTQVGVGLSGDGSFSPDQETTHLKNATSVMNALKILDSVIDQYKYSFVESGYYDSEREEIVLILKLSDNNTTELRIDARSLIDEWKVQNDLDSPVTLSKDTVINGPDVLSANLRYSPNKYNILKTDGQGRLLVKGTADNIVFEGDLSVQSKITQIEDHFDKVVEDLVDKKLEWYEGE